MLTSLPEEPSPLLVGGHVFLCTLPKVCPKPTGKDPEEPSCSQEAHSWLCPPAQPSSSCVSAPTTGPSFGVLWSLGGGWVQTLDYRAQDIHSPCRDRRNLT